MGGQTMIAKPRKLLFIPGHLINFSMTNTSTMTKPRKPRENIKTTENAIYSQTSHLFFDDKHIDNDIE